MPAYPAVRFLLSANHAPQFPVDSGSEVAVAGRSNAGKSSAINVLTERRSLARTSKTPGQTQLINFFELKPGQRLVDLPGYGFAKVPARIRAHWQELVGGYLETRNSLMGLLLIVDARRGLNDDDRGLIGWATQRGRRVHLLLSKSDKLSRNEARRVLAGVRSELPMQASAQLFSAVSKEGVEEGQEALNALLGNKKPGGSGGRATG
ncbi:MAG TPA: ribosome biogenesis GTP-binding protein YihA/YsxC [Steroidobacteraceae bacterium]|nr:ribosome biogenesis GTP-binding protein YihA/YsxC [Steroidobacteraceae bacterium]